MYNDFPPSFEKTELKRLRAEVQSLKDKLKNSEEKSGELSMLCRAAGHLLCAAREAVPGGPTDWNETRKRWLGKVSQYISYTFPCPNCHDRKEVDTPDGTETCKDCT